MKELTSIPEETFSLFEIIDTLKKQTKDLANPIAEEEFYKQAISRLEEELSDKTPEEKHAILNKDQDGYTALMTAVLAKQTKLVEFLLQQDEIDVNATLNVHEEIWTALMFAAFNGQDKIVQLILERDDLIVNFLGTRNRTALGLARENYIFTERQIGRTQQTVRENLILAKENLGKTIALLEHHLGIQLLLACQSGDMEKLEPLLIKDEQNKVDINFQIQEGKSTPLMFSMSEGHNSVVRFLVKKGAKINVTQIVDDRTFTALETAAKIITETKESEPEKAKNIAIAMNSMIIQAAISQTNNGQDWQELIKDDGQLSQRTIQEHLALQTLLFLAIILPEENSLKEIFKSKISLADAQFGITAENFENLEKEYSDLIQPQEMAMEVDGGSQKTESEANEKIIKRIFILTRDDKTPKRKESEGVEGSPKKRKSSIDETEPSPSTSPTSPDGMSSLKPIPPQLTI